MIHKLGTLITQLIGCKIRQLRWTRHCSPGFCPGLTYLLKYRARYVINELPKYLKQYTMLLTLGPDMAEVGLSSGSKEEMKLRCPSRDGPLGICQTPWENCMPRKYQALAKRMLMDFGCSTGLKNIWEGCVSQICSGPTVQSCPIPLPATRRRPRFDHQFARKHWIAAPFELIDGYNCIHYIVG